MKISEKRLARTGYMTLAQAAAYLGMGTTRASARALQRRLESLEKRERRKLLLRVGNGPKPRLYVTQAILRDRLPEHWSQRERLLGVVKGELDVLRVEVSRAKIERRVAGKAIAKLEQRVSRIEAVGQESS